MKNADLWFDLRGAMQGENRRHAGWHGEDFQRRRAPCRAKQKPRSSLAMGINHPQTTGRHLVTFFDEPGRRNRFYLFFSSLSKNRMDAPLSTSHTSLSCYSQIQTPEINQAATVMDDLYDARTAENSADTSNNLLNLIVDNFDILAASDENTTNQMPVLLQEALVVWMISSKKEGDVCLSQNDITNAMSVLAEKLSGKFLQMLTDFSVDTLGAFLTGGMKAFNFAVNKNKPVTEHVYIDISAFSDHQHRDIFSLTTAHLTHLDNVHLSRTCRHLYFNYHYPQTWERRLVADYQTKFPGLTEREIFQNISGKSDSYYFSDKLGLKLLDSQLGLFQPPYKQYQFSADYPFLLQKLANEELSIDEMCIQLQKIRVAFNTYNQNAPVDLKLYMRDWSLKFLDFYLKEELSLETIASLTKNEVRILMLWRSDAELMTYAHQKKLSFAELTTPSKTTQYLENKKLRHFVTSGYFSFNDFLDSPAKEEFLSASFQWCLLWSSQHKLRAAEFLKLDAPSHQHWITNANALYEHREEIMDFLQATKNTLIALDCSFEECQAWINLVCMTVRKN